MLPRMSLFPSLEKIYKVNSSGGDHEGRGVIRQMLLWIVELWENGKSDPTTVPRQNALHTYFLGR